MEALRQKKTVYLEALENLFQELTLARSMSSGGRKIMLLGLLYDVHRVHQFFLQIESNISESIAIHNLLQYDADVDYGQWSLKLDIKFDVNPFYLPDEEDEDADVASVKATLWHIFDTFSRDGLKNIPCDRTSNVQSLMDILSNDLSAEQLVLLLNESLAALLESLKKIHACISRHRMNLEEGEDLYRHEHEIFVKEHEGAVVEAFEDWKANSCDDDEEVIGRNLKGKYCTEMLHLFMSDFLAPRISSQVETDTSEFDREYEGLRFYNPPANMDVKAHYSALREMFDYKDGIVVPKKGHIGKYFFKHRKEVTLAQREALFRFIKMICQIEEEKKPKPKVEVLNYEGIKVNMENNFFPKIKDVLYDGYDLEWLNKYISDLMNSKLRDHIAKEWADKKRHNIIIGNIFGVLVLCKVIEGSNRSIGKLLDNKRGATIAKYMGKQEGSDLAMWTREYIEAQ